MVTRELDFQLSPRGGIEITQVIGTIADFTVTETTDTLELGGVQTLHLETGALETVGSIAAADEDTIDSEILYRQDMVALIQEEAATRGGSHSSMLVTPSGPVIYNPSVFAARNLTHRGEGLDAGITNITFVMVIHYRFVEFSLSELGLIFARRT